MIITLLFSTIVSAVELDKAQVIKDINLMVKSEQIQSATQNDSIWKQLATLSNYSADTWFFLSTRDIKVDLDSEYLSPRIRPKIPDIKAKFSLSAGRLSGKIISANTDLPSDPTVKGVVQTTINSSYQDLQKSNKVYVWELLDKHERVPHYCRNECACIAKELSTSILDKHSDVKLYSLYLQVGGYGLVEIQKTAANGNLFKTSYFYHVALLLEIRGNYFIVDPIALGHPRLTDPSEWLSKFTMKTPITLQISKLVY